MRTLKPYLIGLVLSLSVLSVSGCKYLPKMQVLTQTVANATYLYVEYTAMVNKVKLLPFSVEQRAILKEVNVELDELRLEIGDIFEKKGIDAVISVLKARDYLNSISTLYIRSSTVIKQMYSDLGIEVPADVALFDERSKQVYFAITSMLDSNPVSVKLEMLGFYLKAGMQIYTTVKLGPAAGAALGQAL